MADTYTSSLRIVQETIGGNENTWGTLNNAALAMLDEAIAGQVSVSVTAGDVVLTTANNATDQSRPALLILTGTPATTRNVTMPDVKKITHVFNNCSDGSSIIVKSGAGTSVTVLAGEKVTVYSDGATNVALLRPAYQEGTFTPAITFGGAAVGVTYSAQNGVYTKIGNRVLFDLSIILTSKGSSVGQAAITGFPINANAAGPFSKFVCQWSNILLSGGVDTINGIMASSPTTAALLGCGISVAATALTDANINNNSVIHLSGSYRV